MRKRKHVSSLKVIFDLDDTLIVTTGTYNLANLACATIIVESMGWYAPFADKLIERAVRTDMDMIPALGFSPDRYPSSWVRTYEELCLEHDLVPNPYVSSNLFQTAMDAHLSSFRSMVPGALDALQSVVEMGHKIFVVTSGHIESQLEKIARSGLARHVHRDRIFIATDGKGPILRMIAETRPERPCVMVGDSPRFDIQPALDVGAWAIHIQAPCKWPHTGDISDIRGDTSRLIRLRSIGAVPWALHQIMVLINDS